MATSNESLAAIAQAQAERRQKDAEIAAEAAMANAQRVKSANIITFYHRHPGASYIECIGEGQTRHHIFPPLGLELDIEKDAKVISELLPLVGKTDIFLTDNIEEDAAIQEAFNAARLRAEAAHDKLTNKK